MAAVRNLMKKLTEEREAHAEFLKEEREAHAETAETLVLYKDATEPCVPRCSRRLDIKSDETDRGSLKREPRFTRSD